MRNHRVQIGILAALAIVLWTAPVPAQVEAEMSPEAKAEMEAWMKAATPNENHERLARFEGDWTVTSRFWAGPGAEPQESKGTSSMKMVMDGRYLKEEASSTWMDQPFEGIGYTGYDNIRETYVASWLDNMSTGIMMSEGSWNESDKTFTWTGSYVDVLTGEKKTMRGTMKVVSDDKHIVEYYDTEDGKEYKSMELVYTR